MNDSKSLKPWQNKLHEIIYEADTPAGKLFDVLLLWVILFSILMVMLESVASLDQKYHNFFNISEWIVTIVFTIEYFARIIAIRNPKKYIFSFYGVVDLLSTLPKYISLFFAGTHYLVAIRALRLLRIFRVLKLIKFVGASNRILVALRNSRPKILVFLFAVIVVSLILGTIMYLVEGPKSGFTSIPTSIYWTIVTLTTVGYGDIAPQTALGQVIATFIMIIGYGIIAVPTGIVTAEIAVSSLNIDQNTNSCQNCNTDKHKDGAQYCYKCGHEL
jgi:voltage-gated potassium channel